MHSWPFFFKPVACPVPIKGLKTFRLAFYIFLPILFLHCFLWNCTNFRAAVLSLYFVVCMWLCQPFWVCNVRTFGSKKNGEKSDIPSFIHFSRKLSKPRIVKRYKNVKNLKDRMRFWESSAHSWFQENLSLISLRLFSVDMPLKPLLRGLRPHYHTWAPFHGGPLP